MTSSISAGLTPARSTAALIAAAPSCGAVAPERSPWKPPIGVRAPLTITTESDDIRLSLIKLYTF